SGYNPTKINEFVDFSIAKNLDFSKYEYYGLAGNQYGDFNGYSTEKGYRSLEFSERGSAVHYPNNKGLTELTASAGNFQPYLITRVAKQYIPPLSINPTKSSNDNFIAIFENGSI